MLIIRVETSSAPGSYVHVTVSPDGEQIACSCDGVAIYRQKLCRHIDAVLIANERIMVHPEDVSIADAAYKASAGKIAVPSGWKASWRRDLRWRGLAVIQRRPRNPRDGGKPLVCFTGTLDGKSRKEWLAEAVANGWETTEAPSRFTDVLVAADPTGKSAKLKAARENNTPIVSADEWAALMIDGVLPG